MENKKSEYLAPKDDELDLIEVASFIWLNRRKILKIVGIFILVGLTIAFTSPVEYQSSCKLLPEKEEGGMPSLGGLSSLAGLAGIDIGGALGGSSQLSPELYPQIVYSLPFIVEILNDSVEFSGYGKITPFHYFKEFARTSPFKYAIKFTIGLPGLIKRTFFGEAETSNDTPYLKYSKEEWEIIEKMRKRILITIDSETGIIGITVEMPDPIVAAYLAERIEEKITESVTQYKTEKTAIGIKFIQESYDEAKQKFEKIQVSYARAIDRNLNVVSQKGTIEVNRLEQEYNLAFDIYKGLSSQLEQAKIQLKEETPVFTILEPVRIPFDKSSPKRLLILLLFVILGSMYGVLSIFVSKWFSQIGHRFNE